MFHCPQYSQIQSNDSTPFSATEERSKQWHSEKRGNKTVTATTTTMTTTITTATAREKEEKEEAETSTDSVPPPCKADVQQQQHKASLQRMVTSADMKAEAEDHAIPRMLTPG